METTEVIKVIPYTAWQQAVFVGLFIVVLVIILGWQAKQQKTLQKFISERDIQWQTWIDKTNNRFVSEMKQVTEALGKLSEKIDNHDGKEEERINSVMSSIRIQGIR